MRFSTSTLVLGTLAAGHATAASIAHEGFAGKRHNHAARHAELMKKTEQTNEVEKRAAAASLISSAGATKLASLKAMTGTNSQVATGLNAWVGTDGPFTNEFVNSSGEDLVLAVWGPAGSWINAVQPHLTISIAKNSNMTVSFPINWSGAWAPIYDATTMLNGQVLDTWGEATFNPPHSVFDVSREVNMNGRSMSIVGPSCTSDMNTCVFKCADATATQCTYNYQLLNCATGSQPGANYGQYEGSPSGGCGGMGSKDHITTYLGSNGPVAASSASTTQWSNA